MNDQHVPPGPGGGQPTPPPPGWYVDPGDPHRLRLWDGHVWTEHVSQAPVSTGSVPISVHHAPTSHTPGGFGCVSFAAVALLVIAVIIAVVVYASRLGGPGGEETAVAACRVFVQSRLQEPNSARFSSLEATEGAPDHWTVTGAVDSLSTVGTTETTTFICSVSPRADGTWGLDRLRFNTP
jgi:hypothetical protein